MPSLTLSGGNAIKIDKPGQDRYEDSQEHFNKNLGVKFLAFHLKNIQAKSRKMHPAIPHTESFHGDYGKREPIMGAEPPAGFRGPGQSRWSGGKPPEAESLLQFSSAQLTWKFGHF